MAIRSFPPYVSNKPNYVVVEDTEAFVDMILISGYTEIAVDTESFYSSDAERCGAVTRFVKGSPNNLPFGVSLYCGDTGYWVTKDLHELKPLLEDDSIAKILHNSKYDMHMLKNIGIELRGWIWDTMLMIHLIDEEFMCKYVQEDGAIGYKRSKKLKDLAFHFLGSDAHELEELVAEYRRIIASNTGRSNEEVSYKEVDDANRQLMCDYAVADTEFTYKLKQIFLPMLKEQELLNAYEVDMNATRAVFEIEREGFMVDVERMKADEAILERIVTERSKLCYELAGEIININSDGELVNTFKHLGVEWCWFTDKGEYATDKTVLKELQNRPEPAVSQLAKAVYEFRKAMKILNTYITGVYPLIQHDGKVHCDYWVSPDDYDKGGTKTGRMSSSSPNLQNLTKKPVAFEEEEEDEAS